MTSEKVTFYRTNEDQTEVIEQLPKTITSQVYDHENEQFLDTTIEDINTEITEHSKNDTSKKHIEVVSNMPTNMSESGILFKVDGTQADVPSMITIDELNNNITQKLQSVSLVYKESYPTLADLQSAYPTGDNYNHVILTDGMIYTWSNNTWINTQIQANGTVVAKVVSKQKFNIDTVSNNRRVDSVTGELFESNGYHTSDFIPIETGTNRIIIARINSAGTMNPNNIVYYDGNKVRISGQNTGTLTPDEFGRINLTPPANAKFLRYSVQGVYQRLGIFFNTYSNNFNYYTYYEFDKSKWFGKKVVAYGDSLVGGASNTTTTWLGKAAKILGFEPCNRGIGGSTVLISDTERIAWVADGVTDKSLGDYGEYVSRPSSLNDGSGSQTGTTQPTGTVEITSSMCSDARVNTIPTDAEAIIILAGTNGMDEASYRLMLQKIYARCPQAIVFCCSLPFRYTDAARTQITNVSNQNTIISNLCQEFGSHFIDLKGKEGINHYNRNSYLSDLVHATDMGNDRRAMVIVSVLKSIQPLN